MSYSEVLVVITHLQTLQQLEQRRPEAQRQAEHTEQEIVRFQQTLAEAEVARDDAKAAMRVALDELQVAQDEVCAFQRE